MLLPVFQAGKVAAVGFVGGFKFNRKSGFVILKIM
jgi:hypothetical protein